MGRRCGVVRDPGSVSAMAHQLILRLVRSVGVGSSSLATAVQELATRLMAAGGVEHIRLMDAGGHSSVLIVLFVDAGAMARVSPAFIDPWLRDVRDGLLDEVESRMDGVVEVDVHRIESDEPTPGEDDAERLAVFLRRIAETEAVWCLRGETWARASLADESEALPFWPDEDQAMRCACGRWAGICRARDRLGRVARAVADRHAGGRDCSCDLSDLDEPRCDGGPGGARHPAGLSGVRRALPRRAVDVTRPPPSFPKADAKSRQALAK